MNPIPVTIVRSTATRQDKLFWGGWIIVSLTVRPWVCMLAMGVLHGPYPWIPAIGFFHTLVALGIIGILKRDNNSWRLWTSNPATASTLDRFGGTIL